MTETYKIVRNYFDSRWATRVVATGLTLEEAQAHCRDPETTSSTCRKAKNVRRTQQRGPWFDGYVRE
jgi:hypothetical protein